MINLASKWNDLSTKRISYFQSSGVWLRGDIVFNTQPTASDFVGWVCIKVNDGAPALPCRAGHVFTHNNSLDPSRFISPQRVVVPSRQ